MTNPLEELLPDDSGSRREDSHSWGVIHSLFPLRVRMDGAVSPLEGSPRSLVSERLLRVGDRVMLGQFGLQLCIIGVGAGGLQSSIRTTRSGTASERAAVKPIFGDIWYDTNGNKNTWKGSSTGVWRRISGEESANAGAWDSTGSGIWARTITMILPTAIEPTERILTSIASGGSGFGAASQNSANASNWANLTTAVAIRQYQFLNAQTQSITMNWTIIDV